MILPMPAPLTPDSRGDFVLPGSLTLTGRDVDLYAVEWESGGVAVALRFDFAARTVEVPDGTDPARVQTLQDALAAFGQPPAWHETYTIVRDLALSAVGIDVADLTNAQIKALLALVLWDKRAIADDMTVRPLTDWVARRP